MLLHHLISAAATLGSLSTNAGHMVERIGAAFLGGVGGFKGLGHVSRENHAALAALLVVLAIPAAFFIAPGTMTSLIVNTVHSVAK